MADPLFWELLVGLLGLILHARSLETFLVYRKKKKHLCHYSDLIFWKYGDSPPLEKKSLNFPFVLIFVPKWTTETPSQINFIPKFTNNTFP